MKAKLYNLKNEAVGELEVPAEIFDAKWRPELVKQVTTAQAANRRVPWAHAKDRAQVRGGGRKPWRQKGTGRARHGSIRSPLWRGGGKAHGPLRTRDFSQKINKKMNRLALVSVLSKKFNDDEIKFFETLDVGAPKTKVLAAALRPILGMKPKAKSYDLLLVPGGELKTLQRAGANLSRAKVVSPKSLNVSDLLQYRHVFIGQEAVRDIEATYAR